MGFGGSTIVRTINTICSVGVYTSGFGGPSFSYIADHELIGSLNPFGLHGISETRILFGFLSSLGGIISESDWRDPRHALHRPLAQPEHEECGSVRGHLPCHFRIS